MSQARPSRSAVNWRNFSWQMSQWHLLKLLSQKNPSAPASRAARMRRFWYSRQCGLLTHIM
ncbi:MAG: hypothetical protein B1H04_02270 [Planctomycetales bacterium 4484_123]|nr:MAG: hypothetical protein B1H04_02270 [Planctomycetales bacterium 4484_123]